MDTFATETVVVSLNKTLFPIEFGDDAHTLCPMLTEMVIKQLLVRYNKNRKFNSLLEKAAYSYLERLSDNIIDYVDMQDLHFVTTLPYYKFVNKNNRIDWFSLEQLYRTWFQNAAVIASYIKCDNGIKYTLKDLDISPVAALETRLVPLGNNKHHFIFAYEMGRVMKFDNNISVKYFTHMHKIIVTHDHSAEILLAGDVETNPGPVVDPAVGMTEEYLRVLRKNHNAELRSVQQEVKKLKKELAKHDRFVQRSLELEKMKRKKNRNSDRRFAEGLFTFTDNLGTVAEDAARGLGPTIQMMQDALRKLTELGGKLENMFNISDKYDLLSILMTAISLCDAFLHRSKAMLSVHIIQLARLLHIQVSDIYDLFPSTEARREAQGLQEMVGMAESAISDIDDLPLTGFATFALGLFTLLCSGSKLTSASIMTIFTATGRATSGFKHAKSFVDYIVNTMKEIYYKYTYGVSTEEYKFMQQYPDMEKCYACSRIIRELGRREIDNSAAIAEQILTMKNTLNDYINQAIKLKSISNEKLVRNILQSMTQQIEWASHSPALHRTMRKSPFCLYLSGEPGVGKSVANNTLKSWIWKKYLQNKGVAYKNMSYTRKAKNDHWDGFTGQPILEMDDVGNTKDSTSKPVEEYQELQYIINTAEYPLHMAELRAKGCSNFDGEFVLLSSNQFYPEIVHMVKPSAVYRRLHIMAEVTVKPEYGKPKGITKSGAPYHILDRQKAAKLKNCAVKDLPKLMTEHYEFSMYNVDWDDHANKPIIIRHPELQKLSLEQFWNTFCEQNDEFKDNGEGMAAALRQEAGLEDETSKETDQEIMDRINAVFNADTLLEAIAEVDSDLFGNLFKEEQTDTDFVLHSIMSVEKVNKLKYLQALVTTHINEWQQSFKTRFDLFKSKIVNHLQGVADFIYSMFSTTKSKIEGYFPSIATNSVVAIFGGLAIGCLTTFLMKFYNKPTVCKFATKPSKSISPCRKCAFCTYMVFTSGCAYDHYMRECADERVRKQLKEFKISDATIVELLSAHAQSNYDKGPKVKLPTKYAEKVYENAPKVIKTTQYAQKVYESAPKVPKINQYAQDVVELMAPHDVGSTRFAEGDLVQVEQTTSTLIKNAVWLYIVDENKMASRCTGVFLFGRTFITTAHTIISPSTQSKLASVVLQNPYSSDVLEIPYNECKISQIRQLDGSLVDLALCTLPAAIPSRPKILSKFIDAKDLDFLEEGELVMAGFSMHKGRTITSERHTPKFYFCSKTTQYYLHSPGTCPSGDVCNHAIKIADSVNYDLDTYKGACGSLIAVSNKLIHSKLVGFHVAGGRNVYGLGAVTTRQFLETAIKTHIAEHNLSDDYKIDGRMPYAEGMVDQYKVVEFVKQGDCLSVGTAPKLNIPGETRLNQSLVFDQIQQHTTLPAQLKPFSKDGQIIDPMSKGIQKLLGGQKWVDAEILDIAANDVFSAIGSKDSQPIIYDHATSITGIEGDKYVRPVNRTTSPGYPYSLNNANKGKTAWLGNDETYITDNPELLADTEKLISMAKQGKRGDVVFAAVLKDEKRPIPKVEQGKTRVFEACPQHFVLALRRYYLDFVAHVMKGRIHNGIAVGINPFSKEWTVLANRLLSKGDNMVAGDFSGFDGSLLKQILMKIGEKIREWYQLPEDSEDNMVYTVFWEMLSSADVIIGDQIIRQTHSQPSGNPLTVIINSIFNGIVMRYAYLVLKQKQGKSLKCDYRQYVADICYGDDDIKSISSEILPWFNQITITETLAAIGLTYTDEMKNGAILTHKSLAETTFLKRHFTKNADGLFRAPMDVENILEIANWIKGSAFKQSTLANCEECLPELALHDKSIYDKWSKRIEAECKKQGLVLHRPLYSEMVSEYQHNLDMYDLCEYNPLF